MSVRTVWGQVRRSTWREWFHVRWFIYPVDLMAVATGLVVSYELRFSWRISPLNLEWMRRWIMYSLVAFTISALVFRLYRRIWRYANERDLMAIVAACILSALLLKSVSLLHGMDDLPSSIWLSSLLFTLCAVTFTRLCWKFYSVNAFTPSSRTHCTRRTRGTRTLVFGAGYTGAALIRNLRHQNIWDREFVGFIDDDTNKRGLKLVGLKVFGTRNEVAQIIHDTQADEVIVAVPSIPRSTLREFVDNVTRLGIKVYITNPVHQWIRQSGKELELRPIEVEDLLGRESLPIDVAAVGSYLHGKNVMVTGAGGSIGSEICRQVAVLRPNALILVGRGENSIFEISQELRRKFPDLCMHEVITNIGDKQKMTHVFGKYQPHVVFHAAAHKHVPLMEAHPDEAYKNNVLGTQCLINMANQFQIEKFILISSDKAVRPTNVMGASKRIGEMLVQTMARRAVRTQFITVRFGNVLGSRGSVVQVFRRQIAEGGPVTVTDLRMERYFMTIPEAVRLVVEAGHLGKGGHVYLLNMGQPVRISDLAERMIRLSGYAPRVDIPIQVTGIRPGEKLYEELTRDGDVVETIGDGQLFRVLTAEISAAELAERLVNLDELYTGGRWADLASALRELAWWKPASLETVPTASQLDSTNSTATHSIPAAVRQFAP